MTKYSGFKQRIFYVVLCFSSINGFAAKHKSSTHAQSNSIYDKYYLQAKGIVENMSLEDKIGQMILPAYLFLPTEPESPENCKNAAKNGDDDNVLIQECALYKIRESRLGSVLSNMPAFLSESEGVKFMDAQTARHVTELSQAQYRLIQNSSLTQNTDLIIATDAVHGNQIISNSVLFPQNIGVGVTHNLTLARKMGEWTANDVRYSGHNLVFYPTVDVAKDLRWGRVYESFGQNPDLVAQISAEMTKALQGIKDDKITGVLATGKHFIGPGATQDGRDRGNIEINNNYTVERFLKIHGKGYDALADADVASTMISFPTFDGVPVIFGTKYQFAYNYRTDGLHKDTRHVFHGFFMTDWNTDTDMRCDYNRKFGNKRQNTQPIPTYVDSVAVAINEGNVDMFMRAPWSFYRSPNDPYPSPWPCTGEEDAPNLQSMVTTIKSAIEGGKVKAPRLNEAVEHIIAVKLAIHDALKNSPTLPDPVEGNKIALQAAQESLVLLKNEYKVGVKSPLPIDQNKIHRVMFLGKNSDVLYDHHEPAYVEKAKSNGRYDSIGAQNGGWSGAWQGWEGNWLWGCDETHFTSTDCANTPRKARATSIEDGVRTLLSSQDVTYYYDNAFANGSIPPDMRSGDLAIVVIGEPPYAEWLGDVDNQNPWYERDAGTAMNVYLPKPQLSSLAIQFDSNLAKQVSALREKGVTIVTVLLSGRPMIITEGDSKAPLPNSDAFIAAFLPGTAGGQAIANAIFGEYKFVGQHGALTTNDHYIGKPNTLTFAWPRNMDQVRAGVDSTNPYFPVGYGLSTENTGHFW